ncbi:uncharacterized protein LOC129573436 [Sitodiplosis mosellana]|uniref:uncharacterized protein LOC129573436 n=1 Tax=Sitodiplosis mosellana TaxID=263140 RepID=UPI002443E1E8|nr:uncharacterized protein LOC129573436 [Sitodiplosis mosellana]
MFVSYGHKKTLSKVFTKLLKVDAGSIDKIFPNDWKSKTWKKFGNEIARIGEDGVASEATITDEENASVRPEKAAKRKSKKTGQGKPAKRKSNTTVITDEGNASVRPEKAAKCKSKKTVASEATITDEENASVRPEKATKRKSKKTATTKEQDGSDLEKPAKRKRFQTEHFLDKTFKICIERLEPGLFGGSSGDPSGGPSVGEKGANDQSAKKDAESDGASEGASNSSSSESEDEDGPSVSEKGANDKSEKKDAENEGESKVCEKDDSNSGLSDNSQADIVLTAEGTAKPSVAGGGSPKKHQTVERKGVRKTSVERGKALNAQSGGASDSSSSESEDEDGPSVGEKDAESDGTSVGASDSSPSESEGEDGPSVSEKGANDKSEKKDAENEGELKVCEKDDSNSGPSDNSQVDIVLTAEETAKPSVAGGGSPKKHQTVERKGVRKTSVERGKALNAQSGGASDSSSSESEDEDGPSVGEKGANDQSAKKDAESDGASDGASDSSPSENGPSVGEEQQTGKREDVRKTKVEKNKGSHTKAAQKQYGSANKGPMFRMRTLRSKKGY